MPKSEQGSRADIVMPPVLLLLVLLLAWPSRVHAQQIAPVTVVGLDYAFQAPATLPAGATLDSLIHGEQGAARLRFIEIVGILITEPGGRSLGRLFVDLAPGQSYVLLCNFQDAVDKPRHMVMGMIGTVEVK